MAKYNSETKEVELSHSDKEAMGFGLDWTIHYGNHACDGFDEAQKDLEREQREHVRDTLSSLKEF